MNFLGVLEEKIATESFGVIKQNFLCIKLHEVGCGSGFGKWCAVRLET